MHLKMTSVHEVDAGEVDVNKMTCYAYLCTVISTQPSSSGAVVRALDLHLLLWLQFPGSDNELDTGSCSIQILEFNPIVLRTAIWVTLDSWVSSSCHCAVGIIFNFFFLNTFFMSWMYTCAMNDLSPFAGEWWNLA